MVAAKNSIPSSLNWRMKPSSILPRSDRPDSWYRCYRNLAWDSLKADVYLAFIGSGPLQLSGFLVTAKSDINGVIAHCPVTVERNNPKASFRQIHDQLQLARKIAEDPRLADEWDDVISLSRIIRAGRPVPRWVYALACIPLSYPTDGQFLYPTPFCPRMAAVLTPSR